ncbi:hypothetical protein ACFVH6_13970 [Spirillospora sp. NPDC127200]
MKLSPSRAAGLLLAPALFLAACGGDDEPGGTAEAPQQPPAVSGAPSGAGSPTVPGGAVAPSGSAVPGSPGASTPPGGTGAGAGAGAGGGAGAQPTPKAITDFVACMKRNGIDLPPAGQSMPPDTDKAKMQAATMACVKYMTAAPTPQ